MGENNNLLKWENQIFSPFDKVLHRIKGAIKVNMNEVVSGNFFIKNAQARQSENSQPLSVADIEDISANDMSGRHNTYFEVEVPMDDNWFSINGMMNRANFEDNVNLIAFAQLDIKALSEEFGLNQFVGKLSEYGGPLVFQRLLRLSPLIAGQERYWTVPETISVFFDESGKSYSGPVHYHNGVGYMSGPPEGSMDGRKVLTKRQIPNNKVISKMFMETELDPNGNPIRTTRDASGNEVAAGSDNRFVGYANPLNVTQNSSLSPYGSLNFGDDLLSTLRAEIGLLKLSENATAQRASVEQLESASMRKMKQMVLSSLKNTGAFIGPGLEEYTDLHIGSDTGSSYYETLLPINFENLIKLNSRFGHFIEFHRDSLAGKKRDFQINKSYFTPEGESYWFIKGCLDRSLLLNMRPIRHRVTNSPYSNNKLGTATYAIKDENEIGEILTTSGNNPKATIEQIRYAYSENGWNTILRLKDYDLFRNYSQGKYRYSLEVTIRDGIRDNLKRLYEEFSRSVKQFSNYVSEASRPYISDPYQGLEVERLFQATSYTSIDEEPANSAGNYNYEKQRFTRAFAARSGDFMSMVKNVVVNYIRVVYLLTKRSSLMNQEKMDQLVKFLLPESGDLGNLNMFLDLCSKVETLFKSKIFLKSEDLRETMNYGTFKRSVEKSSNSNHPDSIIMVRAKMPGIIVDTCSKNSVFFELDSTDLEQGIAAQQSPPASGFFTLTQRTLSNAILRNDRRANRVEYDSSGNLNGQSLLDFAKTSITSAPGESFEAAIVAAVEDSLGREVYDSEAASSSDPLKTLDAALSAFGSVSFGYLLSKTLDVSDSGRSRCKDITTSDGQIAQSVQAAIAAAIQSSTDRDMFFREIEDSYKDKYFLKKSLGSLYDFVGSAMATKKRKDKLSKKTNYRELVLSGDQSTAPPAEEARSDSIIEKTKFDIYEMDSSGVFVPVGTSPNDTLGIYKVKPKSTIPTKSGNKLVPVNTIFTNIDSNEDSRIIRRP